MDRLQAWRAGLPDAEGLGAVAAAGLLGPEAEPSWSARELSYEIYERIRKSGGILRWTFRERILLFDARTLAQAWLLVRESGVPKPVSFEVDTPSVLQAGIQPFPLEIVLRKALGAWEDREPPRRDRLSFDGGPDETKGLGSYSVREIEPPEEEPPRFLQARMSPPVQPAWEYRVFVRIGMPGHGWASVEKPFPSLSETETHDLTVLFWEPTVSPDPQIQPLRLPPRGNSSEVRFAFPAAEGLKSIAARITVLHNNRVLQTGLLRASLPALSWTFELDATPRTRLEGLSARGEFDLALVLNHDDQGTARMTAVANDKAVVFPIGESAVEALTRVLGDQISKIADQPERYETLQSEGSEELLRTLAQHGGQLHQYLAGFKMLGILGDGDRQPRIHLTAARPDSFFPIELLYRFEVPEDDAKICEHALTALAQGSCPASCPSDKSETVCPLGFWGMCRVIERHNHRIVEERPESGFDLRPEPSRPRSPLDISGKALLAASDAASRYDKGTVEALLGQLRKRGPAEMVSSWKAWSARVTADEPRLLVLLPHHERKDGFEVLQIGADDSLKSALVKPKHVGKASIVLLMGCETNLAKIAFDSFVIQFILNGAAIVVSTIATVLGRHASPATARLVELLDEEAGEEGSTFGEVMLRLRQKLVAEQTPMALGLTAYGDADWVLTRRADARDRDAPRPLR